jgi:hypothetical protein
MYVVTEVFNRAATSILKSHTKSNEIKKREENQKLPCINKLAYIYISEQTKRYATYSRKNYRI